MRRRIEGVTLRALAASSLALTILALAARDTKADDPAPKPKGGPALSVNDPKAFQGYTLISPFNSPRAYLIDMQGRAVKVWQGKVPCGTAYLLDNGHLLRLCSLQGKEKAFGFLMGQLMRATAGKANPDTVRQLLREKIERRASGSGVP